MTVRITKQLLQERGYEHGRAWEATCPCGETVSTYSTTGQFPPDNMNGYGYWHENPCRNSPPAHEMEWREV